MNDSLVATLMSPSTSNPNPLEFTATSLRASAFIPKRIPAARKVPARLELNEEIAHEKVNIATRIFFFLLSLMIPVP